MALLLVLVAWPLLVTPLSSAGSTLVAGACQEALGHACMCPGRAPGWIGGQVSPTDPGWDTHQEGLGGTLCSGGIGKGKVGMWKEQLCRYLGSRNAHTRHA